MYLRSKIFTKFHTDSLPRVISIQLTLSSDMLTSWYIETIRRRQKPMLPNFMEHQSSASCLKEYQGSDGSTLCRTGRISHRSRGACLRSRQCISYLGTLHAELRLLRGGQRRCRGRDDEVRCPWSPGKLKLNVHVWRGTRGLQVGTYNAPNWTRSHISWGISRSTKSRMGYAWLKEVELQVKLSWITSGLNWEKLELF